MLEKIDNEKNKLVVAYGIHLQTWGEILPLPNDWLLASNEEMPTPFEKIRENELHFEMQKEEYLSSSNKNLDEHFENELNP